MQVHRFRDFCAVSLPGGPTVYLSDKEGRALARAINKVCKSIKNETYLESPNDLTVSIPFEEKN